MIRRLDIISSIILFVLLDKRILQPSLIKHLYETYGIIVMEGHMLKIIPILMGRHSM